MDNCEQQSIEKDWSLDVKTACHVAVLNNEMGQTRDEMLVIGTKVNVMIGATLPIYFAILALVIKQMWGNTKKYE